MYADIEQWAQLCNEASAGQNRAILVLGISECLGTKEMTNGEMARAKANGFVSKSGLKKITKGIEAYYVADEGAIQSLTERTIFWSNCEGPTILDKLNALGLKPSIIISNNSRTDFGLRPSNEMSDNLERIRKQYHQTLPIYYFTASYSDGMRYNLTITKDVLTDHIFTADDKLVTRVQDGKDHLFAYVGTDKERELSPDEYERFTLYTIGGTWKKIEFSKYRAIEFDEDIISTAQQVGWKEGSAKLRSQVNSFDQAKNAQYAAFLKQKSKKLNEVEYADEDCDECGDAQVEENVVYDTSVQPEIVSVGDLMKALKKFNPHDTIKFCDTEGIPVDWKIVSLWDGEYERSQGIDDGTADPNDEDTVYIRVVED